MLKISSPSRRKKMRYASFVIVLIFCGSLLITGLASKEASAHTFSLSEVSERGLSGTNSQFIPNSCPISKPTKPGPNSLLSVLLEEVQR